MRSTDAYVTMATSAAVPSGQIIADLLAVASSLTELSSDEVRCSPRAPAAAARQACWQVLNERYSSVAIARPFQRHHSTVWHGIAQSERRCRVDTDYAYLVAELRRKMRTHFVGGTTRARAQASMWAMDQEIAGAEAIAVELATRIAALRQARTVIDGLLGDLHLTVHDEDGIPTRVRRTA